MIVSRLGLTNSKVYARIVCKSTIANYAIFFFFTGPYEVNVNPTEDSERLERTGNYLMTVRKEYLCLHSAKTGERVLEWELEHLPRFRLQRLSHLQDLDKVLTFQAAR